MSEATTIEGLPLSARVDTRSLRLPNSAEGEWDDNSPFTNNRFKTTRSKGFHSRLADEYKKLGFIAGANATAAARRLSLRFWESAGPLGATWLANRIATEKNATVLESASELLAQSGLASLSSVRMAMSQADSARNQEALLNALSWTNLHADGNEHSLIEDLLRVALRSYDVDVRIAAARATRVLASIAAKTILDFAAAKEDDREVLEAIEEALATINP